MSIINNFHEIQQLPILSYQNFSNNIFDNYFENFKPSDLVVINILSNGNAIDETRNLKLNEMFFYTERLISSSMTEEQFLTVLDAISFINFKHGLFLLMRLIDKMGYNIVNTHINHDWLEKSKNSNHLVFFDKLSKFLTFFSFNMIVNQQNKGEV